MTIVPTSKMPRWTLLAISAVLVEVCVLVVRWIGARYGASHFQAVLVDWLVSSLSVPRENSSSLFDCDNDGSQQL